MERSADSAGVPWAGRALPGGDFAGDAGSADPRLTAALAALAAGSGEAAAVVSALAATRVLVPVVAVLGEGEQTRHGLADKQADMALVTLTSPDGRHALPVFSSQDALGRWDASARPVPVDCRRAAAAAVAQGCDVMVLDPGGPVTFVVSRPAVWAMGQGRAWVPAVRDPQVQTAVQAAGRAVAGVAEVRLEPGERAELRVVVLLPTGLSADDVRAVTSEVASALGASDVVRERVDGVELAVLPY